MHSQDTDPQVIKEEIDLVSQQTNSHTIVLNDKGWDSRVYSVNNGEFFFKFPRSEKIRNRYTQEIAALDIAKRLHIVHVPEILWRDPSNHFFGYRGVPGVVLNDHLRSLSKREKVQVGESIGHFLTLFHTQTFPGLRVKTIDDEISQLHEWYQPAIPVLRQAYTKGEYNNLDTLVQETWPAQMKALGRVAALCHGDLHLDNMLLTPDGALGIIDFGDVAEYDQSKDFIDFEDPAIEAAALAVYGDHERLREKIAVRKKVIQIISLTYNIKKKRAASVQKWLELIRQNL